MIVARNTALVLYLRARSCAVHHGSSHPQRPGAVRDRDAIGWSFRRAGLTMRFARPIRPGCVKPAARQRAIYTVQPECRASAVTGQDEERPSSTL